MSATPYDQETIGDAPMLHRRDGRMKTSFRVDSIPRFNIPNSITSPPAMKIQWRFSGCDPVQKTRIVQAWRDSRPGLEARMGEFDPQAVDVVFCVSYNHAERLPWHIRGRVDFATKPYVAEVQYSDPQVAIDECVGQIADQLACESAHSF